MRHLISQIFCGLTDTITWAGLNHKNIKLVHIWESIRTAAAPVLWKDGVWNSLSIHKCSFILWLAINARLSTKDRLNCFGILVNPTCVLCGAANETHNHLFQHCTFANSVLGFSPIRLVGTWRSILNSPSSKIHFKVQTLFIAVAIYNIWKERNSRVHNSQPPLAAQIIGGLSKRMVRERVFSCSQFKKAAVKDPSLITMLY